MNISAVNCTPIKPQVSFGYNENYPESDLSSFSNKSDEDSFVLESKYDKIQDFADRVNSEYIEQVSGSESGIKKPLAAVVSVGLAGLIAFASGKLVASKVSAIAETLKVNIPGIVDNSFNKVSGRMKDLSGKLFRDNPSRKLDVVKNAASKSIETVEKLGSKVYKKFGTVPATGEFSASKAFNNIGGLLGLSTIFPTIISKDRNKDDVADILQLGQNAYTGATTKAGHMMENVSKIAQVFEALT